MSSDSDRDDEFNDDFPGGFDDDEGGGFDCHMGRDGQCGAAGSEECDFECPIMAEIIRQEARERAETSQQ